MAVREAGSSQRLPASSTMVTPESQVSRSGLITLEGKQTGKPIAGNRHDGFDEAGAGNQLTVWLLRHSQRKRGATARLNLRSVAPVLDPTKGSLPDRRLMPLPAHSTSADHAVVPCNAQFRGPLYLVTILSGCEINNFVRVCPHNRAHLMRLHSHRFRCKRCGKACLRSEMDFCFSYTSRVS